MSTPANELLNSLGISSPRSKHQTALLGLAGIALVGLLALGAALLYPRPERGPDVAWRDRARLGGLALTALGGGAATALHLYRRRRWRERQEALDAQAAGYVTVSLAPRSDQKTVDPTKIDLWQRVGAYVERGDEWPSAHLVFGWVGTQDRISAMMAVPPDLRHSLGVQLNTDFPGVDIVEMAPSPDKVPFGDEDEVMVSPRYYLGQGAVYWQDLVLAGDDSLPLLGADALKRSNLIAALLSLLDGVPGGETWGVQVLLRDAPPGKAGAIIQAVEQRQMQARGMGQSSFWGQNPRRGQGSKGQRAAPISSVERGRLKAKEEKAEQALFEVVLRAWAAAATPDRAQKAVEQLSRLLIAQTRAGRGVSLRMAQQGQEAAPVAAYHWPSGAPSPGTWGHRELAGLFHLPGQDAASVSGKLVTARARKLPPAPAIRRPLGRARDDLLVVGTYRYPTGEEAEVGIPWTDAKVHVFVVGPTGSGKSTTLGNLLLQYVERGAAGLLMEPHGDLVDDVAAALPPELAARTLYVDPLSWAPPAMNVCAVGAPGEALSLRVGRAMDVLQAASGEDWSQMVRVSELVRHGLTVILSGLGAEASIVDLRRVLSDEDWRDDLLDRAELDAQESVAFWRDQFPEWSGQGDALAPVMRRLSPILDNGVMRPILGLPGNTLDIGSFLDQGLLVLVPLMAGVLREKNKNTLGTLVMQQILTAILSRAGMEREARGLAGIFVDEFPDFIGSTGEAVSVLLAQARKFGASVVLAAQSLSQLAGNPRVMAEVQTNCRNKVLYASDTKDAKRAVELLGAGRLLTVDDMVAVGKYRGYVRPTVDRSPVAPAYVRFLPPVASIRRPGDGRRPDPLPLPPDPGQEALGLATRAYKAYRVAVGQGAGDEGRRKVAEFLADLPDSDWQGYQAGRAYLFAQLYNRLLERAVPAEARGKVARMKELTAFRIGLPVYERDAEYRRRLGGGGDDWSEAW